MCMRRIVLISAAGVALHCFTTLSQKSWFSENEYWTYTVRPLSFWTDCAERILRAPSGGRPQKHIGASLGKVVCLVLSEWVLQYLWFVAWNEAVCESLVMDLSVEQRLAIKFCFKAGKSGTEALQMVNAAYGDQALSRSNVFRWYGRFRGGREDIEDVPRSGRPAECRNDNNVKNISQLLFQNRQLSLRMLADEVNIGKDTVRKIAVEDLRKRKICSRFFHTLWLQCRKTGELQLAEIWLPHQTSLRRL